MPSLICGCCGATLDPWLAYKPDDSFEFGKSYCSKKEYEEFIAKEAQKAEEEKINLRKINGDDLESVINDLIQNVCELSKAQRDRIKGWTKGEDSRVLMCFLQENQRMIQDALSKKNITTIYNKLSYIETIVEGEFPAYIEKYKTRKEALDKQSIKRNESLKDFKFIENDNKFVRRKGFSEV